ncbi:MAG: permease-like cell division protein FtsX [Patescibacteria group bacterium]
MKSVKTMLRNARRSPYQAMAAILIMTLTFLTISFFILLLSGSSAVITFFESKPQVTAFFKNEADAEQIKTLGEQLRESGRISSVKYVSKQEALEIYKEQNKEDPLLLDLVTADILPASLEVSTYKIEDLSVVSETLKSSSIVQEVIYQKDIVSALTSWTNAVRKIGFALIVVLSLVSIFIMSIIIGVKISQKKEDIEIMKLIGASNWYIRWPFIYEGIFYGIVGALIGWAIATLVLWYSTPFLASFLTGIPIFPIPVIFFFMILGGELIFAIVLGFISSFVAVLRYLK